MNIDNDYFNRCDDIYSLILKAYVDKSIIVAIDKICNPDHIVDNSLGNRTVNVYKHLRELAKYDLAMTLWQVYCDKNVKANTLSHLNTYLSQKGFCTNKKTKVSRQYNMLLNNLNLIRKEFLAHNDFNKSNTKISIKELYELLFEIKEIYNNLCDANIDGRVRRITDGECNCIEINTAIGMIAPL